MPKSRGHQKRAAKQRKRRDARRKAKPQQGAHPRGAKPPSRASSLLDPAIAEELGYDANRPPDAAQWCSLDERERMSAVARYHSHVLSSREMPPSLSRHGGLHVIVETQLAEGRPAAAQQALQRLLADDMSRHDAVHALGWVAAEHMKKAVADHVPVDDAFYIADLERLTLKTWLQMAGLLRS